jgi:hypothetical protein
MLWEEHVELGAMLHPPGCTLNVPLPVLVARGPSFDPAQKPSSLTVFALMY